MKLYLFQLMEPKERNILQKLKQTNLETKQKQLHLKTTSVKVFICNIKHMLEQN